MSRHVFSTEDRLLCQQKLQLDCDHVILSYLGLWGATGHAMEDRPVTDTVKAACIGEEIEMVPMVSPDVTDSDMELLVKEDKTEDPISLGENSQGKGYLRKRMNLLDSIAFVVGGIIGSGIYIRPAFILEKTGSFGVSMICWLAGMLIAIFGGLCYIELALLIPKTGGEYVYILEGYSFKKRNKWTELLGSLMAFLYTWTAITVIRPTSTSIIVLTCSRYLIRPIYIDCDIPEGVVKCLAISILSKKAIALQKHDCYFSTNLSYTPFMCSHSFM